MPQVNFNNIAAARPPARSRWSLQLALAVTSLSWFVLSDGLAGRAARGLTVRFDMEAARPLLSALFLIFLLIVGYRILGWISQRSAGSVAETLGLPSRATAGREWSLGLALGWGMAVCAVLPMALVGTLHVSLWTEPRAFSLLGLNVATLAVAALATEAALRGYPFQRLIAGIGPTWATLAMAALAGLVHALTGEATGISIVVTMLMGVVFSLAWLRTHGLWLGWGLRFGWTASMAVLFGLPVRGVVGFSTVVQTRAVGAAWLTGDDFGPEAAFFTLLVMIGGLVVLVKTTGDYAWDYTRKEIVAAGYEVNPEAPAAHAAMEAEAAAKGPGLVQILPTTSQSRSVDGY